MTELKPTNPKDEVSTKKLDLSYVPSSLLNYAALAFTEGAYKYGAYNWRVAGVKFSVYDAALVRHLLKLRDGEWADPDTHVPHLASIIACAGILADAFEAGKLNDDRPPAMLWPSDRAKLYDETVAHLQELFPTPKARYTQSRLIQEETT